jgi:uncharacterized protein
MQLTWQPDESPLAVTGVDGGRVRLGQNWRSSSFWVDARQVQDWSPARFEDIDAAALTQLLAAKPEVILLGTGSRHRLLAPALQVLVMQAACGIECMSNAAAARTYNVLLGESRAVLAAFVIEADAV